MINWWDRLPTMDPVATFAVVDGGATHCRVAICNRQGELLSYAVAGPTNPRSVGDARALATLVTAIDEALQQSSVPIELCLVTTAGMDTFDLADRMAAGIQPAVGDAKVVVAPDTLGCWAVTNDLGPAVAVIAGTGSSVVGADRERKAWLRLGGWDYILGDEGSGFGLARAALREALLVSEGRSDAHAIAQGIMDALGLDKADGIADAVHKPSVDKARIAALASVPLTLCANGDKAATQLVRAQVEPLAEAAANAVVRLEPANPLVGCFGGTFKSHVFVAEFEAALRRLLPDRLTVPLIERSALVGAFMIAMCQTGAPVDEVRLTSAAFADHLAERDAAAARS
jgi:N-acetylglucosamine kinase-like BadF-type ATPase